MQISHADITCRYHMQISHADITCRYHMQTSLADITCRHHMQTSALASGTTTKPYDFGAISTGPDLTRPSMAGNLLFSSNSNSLSFSIIWVVRRVICPSPGIK
eukprot:scpid45519/ scgid27111/ 